MKRFRPPLVRYHTWERVANHMDLRRCPDCHGLVSAVDQAAHEMVERDREDLVRLMYEALQEVQGRVFGKVPEQQSAEWEYHLSATATGFDAIEGPGRDE